jgi:hypothetical protein
LRSTAEAGSNASRSSGFTTLSPSIDRSGFQTTLDRFRPDFALVIRGKTIEIAKILSIDADFQRGTPATSPLRRRAFDDAPGSNRRSETTSAQIRDFERLVGRMAVPIIISKWSHSGNRPRLDKIRETMIRTANRSLLGFRLAPMKLECQFEPTGASTRLHRYLKLCNRGYASAYNSRQTFSFPKPCCVRPSALIAVMVALTAELSHMVPAGGPAILRFEIARAIPSSILTREDAANDPFS